jgi:hypothetical protein
MATGLLRANGYKFGERLVRKTLNRVSPHYVQQRRVGTERQTNPMPYFAEYGGHKIHIDQNEKLVRFGVTEVMACDGYSSQILAWSVMPIKNNLTIYDEIYREVGQTYSVFDQVRVDHGKEFILCLYQQERLRYNRTNPNREPFLQTSSTLNHAIERKWVEVNARVNYPIKCELQQMVDDDVINLEDDVTKFCVSFVSMQCVKQGLQNVTSYWNQHSIPGKGIPNILFANNNKTFRVPDLYLPPSEAVCVEYEQLGGRMTWPKPYGYDPLSQFPHLFQQRDVQMPDYGMLLGCLVNGQTAPFRNAVQQYIDLTFSLLP